MQCTEEEEAGYGGPSQRDNAHRTEANPRQVIVKPDLQRQLPFNFGHHRHTSQTPPPPVQDIQPPETEEVVKRLKSSLTRRTIRSHFCDRLCERTH
jgi:hypothetical protein